MAGTWTFVRGMERLELRRRDRDDDGADLIVTHAGRAQEHRFDDARELLAFEETLERSLLAEGWSLYDYYPDRRIGLDRRLEGCPGDRRRGKVEPLRREN